MPTTRQSLLLDYNYAYYQTMTMLTNGLGLYLLPDYDHTYY